MNLQNMPQDVVYRIGYFLLGQLAGLSEVAVRKKSTPAFIRGIADAVHATGVLDATKFASLEVLSNFLQAQGTRVTKLDLTVFGDRIDDKKLSKIMSYCSNLKSLNCPSMEITTKSIPKLVEDCPCLEELSLYSLIKEEADIVENDEVAFVYLSQFKNLRAFNLMNFEDFTDASLKSLSNASSLTSLRLEGCNAITNDGLDFLAKLINLKGLALIGTGGNSSRKLISGFMNHLCSLNLEILDLSYLHLVRI